MVITSWQIRAANTIVKQYVTADEEPVVFAIKSHVTRGVTWHEQNLKALISHNKHVTLFEERICRLMLVMMETITRSIHFSRFENWLFDAMNKQVYFIRVANEPISQNMVNMTMRVDQELDLQLLVINECFKFKIFLFIAASGVDDDTFFGLIIQNKGVFLKRIKNERLNPNHEVYFLQK